MGTQSKEQLEKMTVKELRELAKDVPGIAGIHSMKKDELVSLLAKETGAGSPAPKPAAKKAAKPEAENKPRTKAQIKALLDTLRKEKQNAQAVKDKVRTELLRKRINRLKKQTRRLPAAA